MSAELFKEFLEWKAKCCTDKPGADDQGGADKPDRQEDLDSTSSTHDPTPEPSDNSGRSNELEFSAKEYLIPRPRRAKSTTAVKKFRVS